MCCGFAKNWSMVATIFGLDRSREWLCNDCQAKLMAAAVSPVLPSMAKVAHDTEIQLLHQRIAMLPLFRLVGLKKQRHDQNYQKVIKANLQMSSLNMVNQIFSFC